jgi:vancomycin resistance protein YoaR
MDKIYSSIKRSLNQKKPNTALLSLGILLLFVSAWLIFVYFQYYQDRFYPKTYIDDINLSGLTRDEAKIKIQENMQDKIDFENDSLSIFYKDKEVEAKLNQLAIKNNLDDVLIEAFESSHQSNFFKKTARYYVQLNFDQEKIQALIGNLKDLVDFPGEKPNATIKNKTVEILPGKTGDKLLSDETWQTLHKQVLNKNLRDLSKEDFNVEAIMAHPILALDQSQIEMSKNRALKLIDQKLTLSYEYQKIDISNQELMNFLAWPNGLDQEKIDLFIDNLKAQINRPSSDASFIYDKDTLEVTDFSADKNGLEIDAVSTKKIVEDFLNKIENEEQINGENSFSIPMKSTIATVTLEKANDLGIKEVIGFGESWYAHSIPNRVDNVALATSRISNHIVKPGEEFSFNKILGEVSDKTGYKNAYIIEAGETKLAPGGGVCQVSSTLFRSLLNAGLKVTRRLPHAYRVSYYEIGNEPGFDATVFEGETDLRFINDTSNHILINCQSDSENLYMFCKLYGTSDGRSTEIINYRKWGQSPALPTVYIPDASLRPGQLKQIDWSASGIKSEFTNVIKDKNGEIIREDSYHSSYRPWAAKYLRGI